MTIAALQGWTPQAVVFDCDGLLVDTEPWWTVAEVELFGSRGLTFGPAEKALMIGRSLASASALTAEIFDEPGNELVIGEQLIAAATEAIGGGAEAMPGAHEAVAAARAAGLPTAVASNSLRVVLDIALARGAFPAGSFDFTIAGDEIACPKPHPEIYATCCERFVATPADVLAFEDSTTGVESAKAAGLTVIGVPTLHQDEFPADHVVASLLDDDLAAWMQGW